MKVRGQQVIPMDVRLQRMSIVNKDTGCWEWQGYKVKGYGRMMTGSRITNNRKSSGAHRISYETFIGAIPHEMYVCHRCDNPCCINPEHLFIGTHQDNVNDREKKCRNNPQRGEFHGMAKLKEHDVIFARELRSSGKSFQSIADLFHVNKHTIIDAIKKISWKHIT